MCCCKRAITPGNPLRPYLEGRAQLSVSSMKQILRSHFQEKMPRRFSLTLVVPPSPQVNLHKTLLLER